MKNLVIDFFTTNIIPIQPNWLQNWSSLTSTTLMYYFFSDKIVHFNLRIYFWGFRGRTLYKQYEGKGEVVPSGSWKEVIGGCSQRTSRGSKPTDGIWSTLYNWLGMLCVLCLLASFKYYLFCKEICLICDGALIVKASILDSGLTQGLVTWNFSDSKDSLIISRAIPVLYRNNNNTIYVNSRRNIV